MRCPDLRELFKDYRIYQSADHEKGCRVDPWNLELRGKYGKIYPHGPSRLQAYCSSRLMRGRLEALPGVKIHQKGDFETTVTFAPVDAGPVLGLLKIRRRRAPTGRPFSGRLPRENDSASGGETPPGESKT